MLICVAIQEQNAGNPVKHVCVSVCVCVQEQHTGKQEKHVVYVTVQKTHAGKHVKHVQVCVCVSIQEQHTSLPVKHVVCVCVCDSPRTVRRRAAEATKLKCSPLAQLPEMLDLPSSQNNAAAAEGWCGINRHTE